MKKVILSITIVFSVFAFDAEAASYKQWRNSIKAAAEARGAGDFQKAKDILEAAAPDAAKHGPDSFAENSGRLADLHIECEESDKALAVIDAALEKMGSPSRRSSIYLKGVLLGIGASAQNELKQYDGALADAELARRLIGVGSGGHPDLSNVYALIGEIHGSRKDYAAAETAYKQGLDIAETRKKSVAREAGRYVFYESDYSSSGIFRNLCGLGKVCAIQKREKEAEERFNEALKFAEKRYGKNHQALVIPLSGRAVLYFQSKRKNEFEADTARIYDFALERAGIQARYLLPLWIKFGSELNEGARESASDTAEKIVTVFAVQNYELRSMATFIVKSSQGDRTDRSRVGQAQEIFRKAVSKKFGDTAVIVPLLAEFALDAERAQEVGSARYNYDLILKIHGTDRDPLLFAATCDKVADILIAQKKQAEALPYLQKVTTKLREKYGEDSRVAFAMDREAALLKELGQADAAKEVETKARAIHAKALLKR